MSVEAVVAHHLVGTHFLPHKTKILTTEEMALEQARQGGRMNVQAPAEIRSYGQVHRIRGRLHAGGGGGGSFGVNPRSTGRLENLGRWKIEDRWYGVPEAADWRVVMLEGEGEMTGGQCTERRTRSNEIRS